MPLSNIPDPDYISEESDLPTWNDGEYLCVGIQWFSIARDTKEPVFIQSKLGRMIARAYLLTEKDPTQGPPISVEPHEIPLLVKAFGGNPALLPNMKADYTNYLIAAQNLAKGKKVKAIVKNGWVNQVAGMSVPEGYYRFAFEKFATRDEMDVPNIRQGEYGEYFIASFKVAADGLTGKVSPYNGVIVSSISSYGLVVKNGQPTFEVTDEGKWTANAVRMNKFIRAFAPAVVNANFADPSNILPEFEVEAYQNKYVAVGQMKANKKGRINLDYGSLARVGGEEAHSETVVVDVEKEVEPPGSPALDVLFRLVELEIRKDEKYEQTSVRVANPDNTFTDTAKAWARKFGLKDKASAAGIKNFQLPQMTDEEVVTMCEIIGGETWKTEAEVSLMGQGDF